MENLSRRKLLKGALMTGGLSLLNRISEGNDKGGTREPVTGGKVPEGALILKPKDYPRDLPKYLFGVNSPITYDIPYENPKFPEFIKRELTPGYLRFPGGTVANYYIWRTGYIEIKPVFGGSVYRKQLVGYQEAIRALHPRPITVPEFARMCDEIGCEFVLLPNLESSTIEEQKAWFVEMKSKGRVPRYIEMGNEFAIALLNDAETLRLFPSYAHYRDLAKRYLEAFKPYLPEDAKIALPADGAVFFHKEDPGSGLGHRQWQWDQDLTNESWFQAITYHPYAPSGSIGGGTSNPETPDKAYTSMLARIDEGTDRAMNFFRKKMPGKEVWITEWGLFAGGSYFTGKPEFVNGIWVHQIIRGHFAFLRWPEITMTNMHSIMFSGGLMNTFTRIGGEMKPIGVTGALKWIFEAVNGGVKYQPVEVVGATKLQGQGSWKESFDDVVAAMLTKQGEKTLLIHNAAKEDKVLNIEKLIKNGTIRTAEAIVTSNLLERLDRKLPPVKTLKTDMGVTVPGYSLTRLIWS
jgi:hypothetical protein